MENRINIAELLKDCPSIELYSPIFGNVYLCRIRPSLAVIVKTSDNQKEEFLYDGRFSINGECMLFPSKENRDWNTFQRPFNDGDIIVDKQGTIAIYKQIHKSFEVPCVDFHCRIYHGNKNLFHTNFIEGSLMHCGKIDSARFATEEEKEKLFQAIQDNDYKWNAETKTLEKLEVSKFDITTLKPFDSKVLVREGKTDVWQPAFYGFFHKRNKRFYTTMYGTWLMCIPYNEDTKHLTGTTDDCDNYYKTWE